MPYLRSNPEAVTWKEYTNAIDPNYKAYFVTPDGFIISDDRRYRAKNPDAMTWDQYTNFLKTGVKPGMPKKVD